MSPRGFETGDLEPVVLAPRAARLASFAYGSCAPLIATWAASDLLAGRIHARGTLHAGLFFVGLFSYVLALGWAARQVRGREHGTRTPDSLFVLVIVHALLGAAACAEAMVRSLQGSKWIDGALVPFASIAVLLGWAAPLPLIVACRGAYRWMAIGFAGVAWISALVWLAPLPSTD